MALVKVNGSTFVRDTKTMALVNHDSIGKNEYLTKVRLIKTQKDEINSVNIQISDLRQDLADIKALMVQFLPLLQKQ